MDAGLNYHVYCGGNPVGEFDALGLHTGGYGGPEAGDEHANENISGGPGQTNDSHSGGSWGGNNNKDDAGYDPTSFAIDIWNRIIDYPDIFGPAISPPDIPDIDPFGNPNLNLPDGAPEKEKLSWYEKSIDLGSVLGFCASMLVDVGWEWSKAQLGLGAVASMELGVFDNMLQGYSYNLTIGTKIASKFALGITVGRVGIAITGLISINDNLPDIVNKNREILSRGINKSQEYNKSTSIYDK